MTKTKIFTDTLRNSNGDLITSAEFQCNEFIKKTNCSVISVSHQMVEYYGDLICSILLLYNDEVNYHSGGCEEDITGRFLKGVINNANNYVS